MEIYVLVKQVPDPEAIVKVKSDSELEIENKYFTNFFDEIAIEAALNLKDNPFDLILAGRQAMDDDAGIVGPAVAELLGIPHVNVIIGLEVNDPKKEVKVTREEEGGKEILSCPLPALFTCQKGLTNHRLRQGITVM